MTGARWQHPETGEEITFTDARVWGRSSEDQPEPADVTATSEYKHLAAEMAATPSHEARHAVVGMFLNFKTLQARADLPEDHTLGAVQFDFSGEQWTRLRLAEYAVTLLAGSIGEKAGPPAWPLRADDGMAGEHSDEKVLAHIINDELRLDEKQYGGLVDVARMAVEHPGIKRATDFIATMLDVGVTLDGRMLSDLAHTAWKTFEEETRPRTQDELDNADMREQHRRWMTGVLDAGIQYAEEQAEEKELRRRGDQLVSELESQLSQPAATKQLGQYTGR